MKTLSQGKMSSLLMIIAVAIVFWLACATVNKVEQAQKISAEKIEMLQQQSAGDIPCPPEKIEITEYNINKSDGSAYWTAFGCDGGTYSCTRSGKDKAVNCERADPDLIN
jgi:hypothetical protein